ncbi:MAG: DUF1622 domain-containing protein [Chloroflexi bacterium]|nr:DUF1622 domain-containing protein [Chloroflexota bacterium]
MQTVIDYITLAIGSVAGIIIVYGVILGLVELVQVEVRRFKSGDGKAIAFDKIRFDIGAHLLLGLEFLIAADIIRSVIGPTLEELAILGGIVTIRTVLSYFLGKEVDRQKPG